MKLDRFCISDEEYYNNTTFISYVITRECNAGCWYCHWTDVPIPSETSNDFNRILEFIDVQGLTNVHFTFYGGEPTNDPNLLSYMEQLNERYDRLQVVLITNMMKPKEYYVNMSNISNVRVIASYHSDLVDDIDGWLDKVDTLYDVHIRLMMTDNNRDHIYSLWDKLKQKYNVHIKPIEQMGIVCDVDSDPETPITDIHIVDVVGKNHTDFYLTHTNFKHMMCSSGFVIRENGDVLKCWEDMDDTILMNIFTEKPKKIGKWHLCTHNRCTCGHRFPKMSLRYYGKLHKKT